MHLHYQVNQTMKYNFSAERMRPNKGLAQALVPAYGEVELYEPTCGTVGAHSRTRLFQGYERAKLVYNRQTNF